MPCESPGCCPWGFTAQPSPDTGQHLALNFPGLRCSKHHPVTSSFRCSSLQTLLYFLQKKHMTQLQGINYSRFLDRRSLLYCIPGEQRNVLNLFILQTSDLPEGRRCLHRKEQSSSAWGAAFPALLYEQQHNQCLRHTSRALPQALPLILATGFLVWLFLFTDLLQLSSSAPGGLQTFWRWGVSPQNSGLCQRSSLMRDISILNTLCRVPAPSPKATAAPKVSVPLLRAVTAPALPKAPPTRCTCEGTWTCPPTLDMGNYILAVFMWKKKKVAQW